MIFRTRYYLQMLFYQVIKFIVKCSQGIKIFLIDALFYVLSIKHKLFLRLFAIFEIFTLVLTGTRIVRKSIFDFWRSAPSRGRLSKVLHFVKSLFGDPVLNKEQEDSLKALIKRECEKIRLKWTRLQRRSDLFLNTHSDWLDEEIVLDMLHETNVTEISSNSLGRPQKPFEDCSKKTKKRKVEHLLQEYSQGQLSYATQLSVRASGKRDAATLIQEVATSSPQRATSYKKTRKRILMGKEQRPYTPEEALAFFVSNDFTVQTYKNTQQEAKERGFNLYPSYDQVARVKIECYPPVETITITDISAEVNLQSLLNHTSTRICKNILGEVMIESSDCINYTLIYKWGCDGSSGHSLYKQKFNNVEDTDEYMFIISLVPIRLVQENMANIVWQNPRPSSPRFCRIIKFIYKKETYELIKNECSNIEKQIKELVPTQITIESANIFVTHKLILTMVDGKVCNTLSENKSTQRCFICKATAKEMNLINIVKVPEESMYKFGISSLHAYIRTMECLLNIAYRLDICEWQVRGNKNKEIVKKKKEDITKKFKEIGLLINKVKPGYGTSNDGNTARYFFAEYSKTASIIGLDENLIYRLGTILKAIASGYEINPNKFEEYCSKTRRLYIDLYPWYNMPTTVHKLLVHGSEIIRHSIIPVGQMSEEASEAKNKEIRKARLGHTLKISRVRTNYDLFKYLLLSSDPYISLLRKLPRKNKHKFDVDLLSLIKT